MEEGQQIEARYEIEPEKEYPPIQQHVWMILVGAVVILADQFSKRIVETALPVNHFWAPIPEIASLFKFTHVYNTGAAFGLFSGGGMVFGIIALIVSGVLVYYNFHLPPGHLLLRTALGLQLGGALGNFIDRLRLGHVTDFLDFGPWPVFNVADTSVVAGVVILGYLMWQDSRQQQQMPAEAGDSGV
jgi:signal peptidase II